MSDLLPDETLPEERRHTPPAATPTVAQLFVALECAHPLAGPARHSLQDIDEVVIGRGAARSSRRTLEDGVRRLLLQIPDARVSARHACVRRTGAGWELADLGSRNGTRLDDAEVTSATLGDRTVIECGHTLFVFRSDLPTPARSGIDLDAGDLRHLPQAFATLMPELSAGFETLASISKSTVPILLLGETGSGKEVLARAIHAQSGRSGEFVAINCGAIPDSLMEAQLFGHVRGAFSGALRDEPGYVRAAHKGTLFLDEIGELPQSSQAALLRVLQEHEIVPIGSTKPIAVDIRVVTATHAPIDALVARGAFRNDLFARLLGYRFHVPPLRDRIEDLGLLIANLLPELGPGPAPSNDWSIDLPAARALFAHEWPRNVRELKQCLAAAAVLGDYRTIELSNLSQLNLASEARAEIPKRASSPPPGAADDEQLRKVLIATFRECKGNVSEVARKMGKARVQIQRWMKRFSIDPATFR